jgi:hypothetical protein
MRLIRSGSAIGDNLRSYKQALHAAIFTVGTVLLQNVINVESFINLPSDEDIESYNVGENPANRG